MRLLFIPFFLTTAALVGVPAGAGVNLLEQSSQAFTTVAKKAMPATVYIKSQMSTSAGESEFQNPFDMLNDDFFRRFFGGAPHLHMPTPQPREPQIASGSGFLISDEGYIVTNHHVVKDAAEITVILNDGREYVGTIVGGDASTDLALLKIDDKNLPFLSFGESDEVEVGAWVVAVGNPFAFDSSLTVGVVSAKGRQGLGLTPYEDYIQTDAAINPGNSGGPLLNLKGEVVGINTAIFSRTGGSMGIGFAIPSKMAQNVIHQIKEGGSVKRGYLGIVLQPIDKDLVDALNLEKQEGLLVSEVMKDSPAAAGGLLQGDIIIQSNGSTVKNLQKFRQEIGLMNPGEAVELKILRNGKPMTLNFHLGAQTPTEFATAEILQKLGIEVETLTPELSVKLGYPSDFAGVAITKVKPNSPAAHAGLKPTQVIVSVAASLNNQKRIGNISEFEDALRDISDRKHLILVVRHQNLQRYCTLKIN